MVVPVIIWEYIFVHCRTARKKYHIPEREHVERFKKMT